jgi:hypothetical protein
MMVLPFLP